MPNNFSAFFETLIAAEAEYNKAKVGQTAMLDRVYKDVKTESARIGKTVDVYFPDFGPLQAVNNGQLTPRSVSPNYIPLVFQNRVGAALLFEDFEQWQTATDLAQKFFDPLYKRAREYLNGQLCALATPANFTSNAYISGSKAAEVQVPDMLSAWSGLADAKVPMRDTEKLHLCVHNQVLRNMLGDAAWTQENIVSAMIAIQAREKAELVPAFRFNPVWDQQMPTASGSIINGQVQPTNGSTSVTGSNTAFTTDLSAGVSYITFGCDTSKTKYLVQSIASDTSLTLGSSYGGTTPATPSTARAITILAGTVAVNNASATVTGTGTSFTTALTVGQWLIFSNDATNTPYQVLSIAGNTSLTLASNYGGSTASGLQATVQWYNSLAFHEYAIALALRPIFTPPEARDVLDVTYIDLQGIPLRVMVSYQHIYQGLYVTVDFGYALGVIRPDFGIVIQT